MRRENCSKLEAVTQAIRTQVWPESVAAHAEECEICQDVAQTARWLQALASGSRANESAAGTSPLPDPGLVWWKAQLTETDSQNKRAQILLEGVQIGSTVIIPIGLAGWVAWNWYSIELMAERFLVETWPQISFATYTLASLVPAFLTLAALALSYPLLVRE